MGPTDLWGYHPKSPISEDIREVYSAVLPHFVEYALGDFIRDHVASRRQDTARSDALKRLAELTNEARFCQATGRPAALGGWYVGKRRHAWSRAPKDLRERHRRLPTDGALLVEYEDLLEELQSVIPRRKLGDPVPARLRTLIQELYPALGWRKAADSVGVTPSAAARKILATSYGVSANGMRKAIEKAQKSR